MKWIVHRIGERAVREEVEAGSEREALAAAATLIGIDPTVRRDGGGLLYVGDAIVGRYRARVGADLSALAARYSKGQPVGMPPVLAAAIEGSDWR